MFSNYVFSTAQSIYLIISSTILNKLENVILYMYYTSIIHAFV